MTRLPVNGPPQCVPRETGGPRAREHVRSTSRERAAASVLAWQCEISRALTVKASEASQHGAGRPRSIGTRSASPGNACFRSSSRRVQRPSRCHRLSGYTRVPSTGLRLVVMRPGNSVRAPGISPPHHLATYLVAQWPSYPATQLPSLDRPTAVAPHDRLRAPWRVPRETEENWRGLVPDRSRIPHTVTQPIVSVMNLEYNAASSA